MDCKTWLEKRLSDMKVVNIEKIKTEGKEKGYSKGQLSEARKILGVATVDDRAQHNGVAQNWYWCLPKGEKVS